MKSVSSAVELLQELVRIPSVNPAGDPGNNQVGEQAIAEFLAEFCRETLGAETELDQVLPGRPNLIARLPHRSDAKRRLLLAPHIDTVSVRGMSIDPFSGEIRDGRLWGRGACDTKGTIAAMLWALIGMRDQLETLDHEIWFIGLMGEEAGHTGARALAPKLKADFALIGEPTENQIVYTHKGSLWLRLKTKGKSAHSSRPELGDNAIYKMADVLRCIRDEFATELAAHSDPVLGSPTCNAGMVHGGSKINIVPETCEVELDIRTIPSQHTPELVDQVRQRLRQAHPEIEVEVINEALSLQTPEDNPYVRLFAQQGAGLCGAPWFCDASIIADAGIPAVAAGPGSIQQAHTADEWISVEAVEEGVTFYRRFLEALDSVEKGEAGRPA